MFNKLINEKFLTVDDARIYIIKNFKEVVNTTDEVNRGAGFFNILLKNKLVYSVYFKREENHIVITKII